VYVDLHIHTTASDGTWDCDELIAELRQVKVSLFSITDHDTVKNSRAMLATIHTHHEFQGRFVVGAEISCTWQNRLYHLTAYNFDPDNARLLGLLEGNRQIQLAYNTAIMQALSERDGRLDLAKFRAYQYNRKRGGWNGLNFLLDEGIFRSVEEYLRVTRSLDFSITFPDPSVVIDTIRTAGGVAFLAHPTASWRGQRMPDAELDRWLELGLTGVECYSSYCSPEHSQAYVQFCRQRQAAISTGSDCHGTFVPERGLGQPHITLDQLNLPFL
jgi:3',5'-nucleoside bisphosphate phosphatase